MAVLMDGDYVFGRIFVCEECGKICVDGYDLCFYYDREKQIFELMHFCSTSCLSRWIRLRGPFYEEYSKEKYSNINSKIRKIPSKEIELSIGQIANQAELRKGGNLVASPNIFLMEKGLEQDQK